MDDIKIRVIDSKKLIEAINTGSYEINLSAVMALGAVATQSASQWIPCSEKLPEEDTEVLISYRYKEGEGDTDHVNIDITSYGTVCFGGREIHTLKKWRQPFDYFHANYEVIAWMPLPAPAKMVAVDIPMPEPYKTERK